MDEFKRKTTQDRVLNRHKRGFNKERKMKLFWRKLAGVVVLLALVALVFWLAWLAYSWGMF